MARPKPGALLMWFFNVDEGEIFGFIGPNGAWKINDHPFVFVADLSQ